MKISLFALSGQNPKRLKSNKVEISFNNVRWLYAFFTSALSVFISLARMFLFFCQEMQVFSSEIYACSGKERLVVTERARMHILRMRVFQGEILCDNILFFVDKNQGSTFYEYKSLLFR
ncbi:MAG: hypothetical protein RBT80_10810 [Candidatus Vecturithrix sp.]|nr:hypothetical protein [Candidatus Vecturithrix sp.]